MCLFQSREKEKADSISVNLSDLSMPSGYMRSVLGWIGDLFSKEKRAEKYLRTAVAYLKASEVRLNESINDFTEELATFNEDRRKKDEYFKTLNPDTREWRMCELDRELDVVRETSLNRRLDTLHKRALLIGRLLVKLEEGAYPPSLPLNIEDCLSILERRQVAREVNRREESRYEERLGRAEISRTNEGRS